MKQYDVFVVSGAVVGSIAAKIRKCKIGVCLIVSNMLIYSCVQNRIH